MVRSLFSSIVAGAGKSVSWLSTFLVLLICLDVIFRYIFNFSKTWILDLEWHFFAALFLLGSAYALQKDKHVRVDLFYSKWSDRKKAWVNLTGTILLCLPWAILLLSKAFNYAMNSWYIREGSANPGGLEARYVIKFVMVIGFILLIMQALVIIIDSIKHIRN